MSASARLPRLLALVPWLELAQRDVSDSAALEAKIAVREPMPGGGIRYRRRVPDVDMRGYARWFNRNKHVGDGLMLMGPG